MTVISTGSTLGLLSSITISFNVFQVGSIDEFLNFISHSHFHLCLSLTALL